MQAAHGDNGRTRRRGLAIGPRFTAAIEAWWPLRRSRLSGQSGLTRSPTLADATVTQALCPGIVRRLALVTLAALTLGLAACQTAAPVPVEVRTTPGIPGQAQPAPADAGAATGTGVAQGPLPGTSPVGPSGRPLRTEPYGLKRGYGEPPRQPAAQPGSTGIAPAAGGAPAGGQSPAAATGTVPGGAAMPGGGIAGGAGPGGAMTGGAVTGSTAAGAGAATGAEAPPIAAPTVLPPASSLETRPPVSIADPAPAGQAGAAGPGAAGQGTAPDIVATAPATAAKASGSGSLDGVRFGWPLKGTVLQDFGQTSSRGLSIGSRPRSAVVAAADGRVIFSGAGPREYGNLIIVKHANELLSVYANNSSLAVKEGQDVRRGQKIAEAGGAANRPQLHFEIRQQGKPIDPLTVLPAP